MITEKITSEKMTEGQQTQIRRVLEDGLRSVDLGALGFSKDESQKILEKGDLVQSEAREAIVKILQRYSGTYSEAREDWQKFYKTHFNWDVDFSTLILPPCPGEGWRLILVAKGMTMNKAFDRCKALFKSWRYNDNLDKAIPTNVRTANQHYAVWVRTGAEPDAEFLGKSTNQVDPTMKLGMTLLERIILEIKYFSETGSHLDIKGVTFCSGSRDSDGNVPSARWYGDDEFGVDWYYLGDSDSGRGIRQAVAL